MTPSNEEIGDDSDLIVSVDSYKSGSLWNEGLLEPLEHFLIDRGLPGCSVSEARAYARNLIVCGLIDESVTHLEVSTQVPYHCGAADEGQCVVHHRMYVSEELAAADELIREQVAEYAARKVQESETK